MSGLNKSATGANGKAMPRDEDGNPNDADDKGMSAKMAKRKLLAMMVAKGGMGIRGPDAC